MKLLKLVGSEDKKAIYLNPKTVICMTNDAYKTTIWLKGNKIIEVREKTYTIAKKINRMYGDDERVPNK